MTTILIADDERNIRTTLRTTLELEGYQVVEAENGRQALEALGGGDLDLAILDLQMPVLDGLETLREIRGRNYDLPVMILTAHGSIEKAVDAVRFGAFDFIEKPFHPERLLELVKRAVETRWKRRIATSALRQQVGTR